MSPGSFSLVRRLGDDPVEARDRVLQHGREIIGKDVAGARPCNRRFARSTSRTPGAAVRGVGPLQVAEYPLDLALLGQRHGHVEVQPDDVAIEVLRRQQAAQLVHVAALHVDPSPERDRLGINARTQAATEQRDECDLPAPGSSKFVGSGAPG